MTMSVFNLEKLVKYFVQHYPITTIILYGSTSRKKVDIYSDIDLLLIFDSTKIDEEYPIGHQLRESIPDDIFPRDAPLSLSTYSTKGFIASYNQGSLFILHIIEEGTVYFDRGFYEEILKIKFRLSNESLIVDLQKLSDRLDITNNLSKFNSYFIRAYTIFYAILRNLAFIAVASEGTPVFDRDKAIVMLMELYPSHKKVIQGTD